MRAGTLKAGDSGLAYLLQNVVNAAVDAGATLDIAGFDTLIGSISGQGTITNSGSLAQLAIQGQTVYGGTLSGALALTLNWTCNLLGLSKFTGNTTVAANRTLTNGGTFDLTTNAGVTAGGAGTSFANNGLFEKTGGGGTSLVRTPFTNDGNVIVTSGSVLFTGGFTNVGVVRACCPRTSLAPT